MTNDISALLKEAKPLYVYKQRQKKVISSFAFAGCLFLMVSLNGISSNYSQEYIDEVAYGSVIADSGFDVDEYGLLEV